MCPAALFVGWESQACAFLTPRAVHELEFQLSTAVTGSQEHLGLLPSHSYFSSLLHHVNIPTTNGSQVNEFI